MRKFQGISEFSINEIKDWKHQTNKQNVWVYARPLGNKSLLYRLKCAWKVFKCEYDIITWDCNQ